MRCEFEPARVGQLETQLIGGDDRDSDRRRFQHRLETNTRVNLPPGEILGCAMAFLGNARQLMDVNSGAESLGDGLYEFEIFGVEVATVVISGDDDRADRIAVRLDRTGDDALLGHRSNQLLLRLVATEIDHGVPLHVGEKKRPADLKYGSRNSFARSVRRAIQIFAVTLRRRDARRHSRHPQFAG